MTERKRQSPSLEQFEDPLRDYAPAKFDDALEQALCEELVTAVRSTPIATIPTTATIRQALDQLSQLDVACLLVTDGGALVGIFTERDVLNKVAPDYEAAKRKCIAEVMTPDPAVIYETDHVVDALAAIAISRHRHVPVLDVDEHLVGVVSPQRINAFLQDHFQQIGKAL